MEQKYNPDLTLEEKINIIETHFATEALAYALDKRALRTSLVSQVRTLALNEYQGHLDKCNALLDAAIDLRAGL